MFSDWVAWGGSCFKIILNKLTYLLMFAMGEIYKTAVSCSRESGHLPRGNFKKQCVAHRGLFLNLTMA